MKPMGDAPPDAPRKPNRELKKHQQNLKRKRHQNPQPNTEPQPNGDSPTENLGKIRKKKSKKKKRMMEKDMGIAGADVDSEDMNVADEAQGRGVQHRKRIPDSSQALSCDFQNVKKKAKDAPLSNGHKRQLSLCSEKYASESIPDAVQVACSEDAAAVPAQPAGMEIYWKLASVHAQDREAASVALVYELQAAQDTWEANGRIDRVAEEQADEVLLGAAKDEEELQTCAPTVKYALRRLFRGVSSSRESARQGFALALASVLGVLHCIKGEAVLSVMKKNLDVTSSMKGQEARDKLLGQLFAYGAIVRADRLIFCAKDSDQTSLAKEVTEQLLVLARKKSFLREPATIVLVHLIEKLPSELFQGDVIASPLFKETLSTGWDKCSADILLLVLCVSDKLTTPSKNMCPMLQELDDLRDLFTPSHLRLIVPCLKDSSYTHPHLHPVWIKLVDVMFADTFRLSSKAEDNQNSAKKKKKRKSNQDGTSGKCMTVDERLAVFWSIVVDKALLNSSHERKHLVMELLLLLLPRLPASSVHIILSVTFVHCLLDILSAKDALLYKSAQRCIQELCQWAKEDEHRLTATVISLQQGSHGKFDCISRTQTVKSLLNNFSSRDGCFFFFNCLADFFTEGRVISLNMMSQLERVKFNDPSQAPNEEALENKQEINAEKAADNQRLWVLDQMLSFCKQVHVEQAVKIELHKELMKFLGVHALFVASPGTKVLIKQLGEEVKWPEVPISEDTRKWCLVRLQGLLVDAQQLTRPNKSMLNAVQQDGKDVHKEDLVSFFLWFFDLLERCPSVSCSKSLLEDDSETFSTLKSALFQISSAVQRSSAEQREKLQAMCFLLLQLFLQLMISRANETVRELIICCKKAFGDLLELQVEDDEENDQLPALVDVLVDVLLSLLAQSSAPVRVAAEQVFKSFYNDITDMALLNMLRIVKKQLKAARHKALAEESDDEQLLSIEDSDDEMDIVEEADELEEMEYSDQSAEVGSDDDGQSSRNKKAPISIRQNPDEEMDEEPYSDVDDDVMFRVDVHLAKILKQKKKMAGDGGATNKDAQMQLMHFKFRVLSLLEFFMQKKANTNVGLIALPHLLHALVLSCSTDGSQDLVDRIGSILQNQLFKAKRYPRGSDIDIEMTEGLLQRSLKLASRTRFKKVNAVAQASSLWLLKVLHGHHQLNDDQGNIAQQIFENALEDFFGKKKSRLKSTFFHEAFSRFPWLGSSSLKMLLDRCLVARSEYLQFEAVHLVSTILRPKLLKEMSQGGSGNIVGEFLQPLLPTLSEVLVSLLEKPASKAARRSEARRFCTTIVKLLSQQFQVKPLKELLGSAAYDVCAKCLGMPVMEGVSK